MRFVPQPCAEFPNDNPELHDGASWLCAWTRARPRAVVAALGVARRSSLPELPKRTEPGVDLPPVEPPPIELEAVPEPFGPEDADQLSVAFDTYLGPDAHTPSEELSVILSATMPPTVKRSPSTAQAPTLRIPRPEPEQLDWISEREPGQLALDLRSSVPCPLESWVPPKPSASDPDDVVRTLSRIDEVFAEDEYSPVPPAVGAATSAPAEPLEDEAPTPVLPVASRVHAVEGPSAPEPLSDEATQAARAVDELFADEGAIAWQTPGEHLAVVPESGSFRVPRPSAFETSDEVWAPAPAVVSEPIEPLELELTPPPPGVLGFESIANFVSGFLLSRGQTRAAALCPALLAGRRIDIDRLPEATRSAMVASGIARTEGDAQVLDPEFRSLAANLHLDFMAGRADTDAYLAWLASVVGALLGHSMSLTAVRLHLEQAGIEKLLRSAA